MKRFDPKQVVVLIDGTKISDWADGSDVIAFAFNADAGGYTMGADGTGVFVGNADRSGKLTLKIKQHSPDSAELMKLYNQQKNDLKGFTPITLSIRDLLNDDQLTAQNGYFTTSPTLTRGQGHNANEFVIEFEKANLNLAEGL
ncbi:phage structural protein [Lonepinella sp. BR2904]|uniref:phage structural protein n=1 Tax=Lonepinella sp. BR2904 TaxID=3434551 RepID=UPI003F6DE626